MITESLGCQEMPLPRLEPSCSPLGKSLAPLWGKAARTSNTMTVLPQAGTDEAFLDLAGWKDFRRTEVQRRQWIGVVRQSELRR